MTGEPLTRVALPAAASCGTHVLPPRNPAFRPHSAEVRLWLHPRPPRCPGEESQLPAWSRPSTPSSPPSSARPRPQPCHCAARRRRRRRAPGPQPLPGEPVSRQIAAPPLGRDLLRSPESRRVALQEPGRTAFPHTGRSQPRLPSAARAASPSGPCVGGLQVGWAGDRGWETSRPGGVAADAGLRGPGWGAQLVGTAGVGLRVTPGLDNRGPRPPRGRFLGFAYGGDFSRRPPEDLSTLSPIPLWLWRSPGCSEDRGSKNRQPHYCRGDFSPPTESSARQRRREAERVLKVLGGRGVASGEQGAEGARPRA